MTDEDCQTLRDIIDYCTRQCEGVKDWPWTAENKAVIVYAIELSQIFDFQPGRSLGDKAVAGTGLSAYFTTNIGFFA